MFENNFLGRRHSLLSSFFYIILLFCQTAFSILFRTCVDIYIYIYIYIYTHVWLHRDCKWITVDTKLYCKWNIFTQIRSGAKCWLDIYHWGAGLAVTGRIRHFRKHVLQFSFQTGSSSGPSYFQITFFIAFIEEAFFRNLIIILRIKYTNIILIHFNNNAIINNSYEWLTLLILFFKIPKVTRRNYFEIYRKYLIWYDIFVYRNWVDTRWQ